MFDVKKFLKSAEFTNSISTIILRVGCFLASYIMFLAVDLSLKVGYNYDRQMLHNYMAETACLIFFFCTAGSFLFEYMLLKKKENKDN